MFWYRRHSVTFVILITSCLTGIILWNFSSEFNIKVRVPTEVQSVKARRNTSDSHKRTSSKTKDLVGCISRLSRLGNQLSRLATLYATAQDNNFTPVLMRHQATYLDYYFDIDYDAMGLQVFGKNDIPSVTDISWNRVSKGQLFPWERLSSGPMLHSDSHTNHRRKGWMIKQYPNKLSQFYSYLNDLKRHVHFKHKFLEEARAAIGMCIQAYAEQNKSNLTSCPMTVVGVHLRLGDTEYINVLREAHPKSFYPPYIERAMNYYFKEKKQLPNKIFLFVSNNVKLARNMVMRTQHSGHCQANSACFFFGPKKVEKAYEQYSSRKRLNPTVGRDLAILASCHHHILTYGTFGTWGALLSEMVGKNIVLLPLELARKGTNKFITKAKLPGWINI